MTDYFAMEVLGRFAGHVHWAGSTDEILFTQISSISQAGETSFTTFTIGGESQGFEVDAQLGRDVVTYTGGAGDTADVLLWEVVPVPGQEGGDVIGSDDGVGLNPADAPQPESSWLATLIGVGLLVVVGGGAVVHNKQAAPGAKESIYGADSSISTDENPARPSSAL